MTLRADVVIGMDIGTTSAKAVVRSVSHRGAPYVEQPTPWHTGSRGQTEIDPYRLLGVAVELIGRAVREAESAWGPVRVRGLGVAGMAESGVLLSGAGRAVRAGDRLVRSPRRPRDRAGRRGSPRVRRRVRAHHRSSVVEPGQHRQAAVAARQRVSGGPRVDVAERARMDRLRPRRRPGSRAVTGFPDRSHRSGHGRVVARCRGDGRAVSPDSARRTAGRRPRGLRAARRSRSPAPRAPC